MNFLQIENELMNSFNRISYWSHLLLMNKWITIKFIAMLQIAKERIKENNENARKPRKWVNIMWKDNDEDEVCCQFYSS